jgi:hypothetical protein
MNSGVRSCILVSFESIKTVKKKLWREENIPEMFPKNLKN